MADKPPPGKEIPTRPRKTPPGAEQAAPPGDATQPVKVAPAAPPPAPAGKEIPTQPRKTPPAAPAAAPAGKEIPTQPRKPAAAEPVKPLPAAPPAAYRPPTIPPTRPLQRLEAPPKLSSRVAGPAPASAQREPPLRPAAASAVRPAARPAARLAARPAAPAAKPFRPPRRINWALWIGALLVAFVAVIALWGPQLAPQDPLKATVIIHIDGKWVSGPYAPFQVSQFPLGTDAQGHDILSMLLWAVRPTMSMVAIVAVIRLLLGLFLGLLAGWSQGWLGRLLESAISAAVALPVLIVSLAVIAAVGIDLGVSAFILGLAATGWAETARQVREQTRAIRSQLYIESARALGLSDLGILYNHVARQISPMIWMLLAFEVSSTLLTAAGLGFLGYFIGGEVWTAVTDTTAMRSGGMPELGLMMATLSTDIFTGVYKMVAAGSMVFVTILGFNLLGEGLRVQMEKAAAPRPTALTLALETAGIWWEDRLAAPALAWVRASRLRGAALSVLLVAGLALVYWQARSSLQPQSLAQAVAVPGGHQWASERHDPYGTLQTSQVGPRRPEIVRVFKNDVSTPLSGGPAIAANGTLYLAAPGELFVMNADAANQGFPRSVGQSPVGSPALSKEGRLYLADAAGGLTAFSPRGDQLWTFRPQDDAPATSGPVVDADGNIYYQRGGAIQAVDPLGQALWLAPARPSVSQAPLILLPDSDLIALLDGLVDRRQGTRPNYPGLAGADQFIIGADGNTYVRMVDQVSPWAVSADQLVVATPIPWDARRYAFGVPRDSGVASNGMLWLLYFSRDEDANFIWVSPAGEVLSQQRFQQRAARVIAIDGENVAYVCGSSPALPAAECRAISPSSDQPLWVLELPDSTTVSGGALGNDRLYVASGSNLYVIGDP